MTIRSIPLALWIVSYLGVISSSALARSIQVNILTTDSKVTFRGSSKLLDFEGEGTGVVGNFKLSGPNAVEGLATFQLSTLNTGLSLRDKHMKSEKTLHVEKFPEAKFVPTSMPWDDPSKVLTQSTEKGRFEGKLSLHGVEKNIKGDVSSQVIGDKVSFKYEFEVSLNDFSIKAPEFSGVKVKDTIQVVVTTLAKVDAL